MQGLKRDIGELSDAESIPKTIRKVPRTDSGNHVDLPATYMETTEPALARFSVGVQTRRGRFIDDSDSDADDQSVGSLARPASLARSTSSQQKNRSGPDFDDQDLPRMSPDYSMPYLNAGGYRTKKKPGKGVPTIPIWTESLQSQLDIDAAATQPVDDPEDSLKENAVGSAGNSSADNATVEPNENAPRHYYTDHDTERDAVMLGLHPDSTSFTDDSVVGSSASFGMDDAEQLYFSLTLT